QQRRAEGAPQHARGERFDAPRREAEAPIRETDPVRRERAQLLRDFERTTLSPANFCVLKGIKPAALEEQLALARQEARERMSPPPRRDERAPREGGRRDAAVAGQGASPKADAPAEAPAPEAPAAPAADGGNEAPQA
ncbi:prop effector ProQ, partial [Azohydromonas lata]|nr:prop effector ProQ [Azohydromonas lata]